MADIVLGLFAVLAGAVILFAGQFVLRLVIPIWGFFAGFAFGAGLFAGLADERFLGSVLGWISGFVCALIFALLAYLFYAVAVVLAMAAFGFAIGSGLVVALGIDWSWVAVLVGSTVGGVGSIDSSDFTQSSFTDAIQNSWLWTLLVVALAVAGIVAQTRARVTTNRTVREAWYAENR
jgi:hypothetical protein